MNLNQNMCVLNIYVFMNRTEPETKQRKTNWLYKLSFHSLLSFLYSHQILRQQTKQNFKKIQKKKSEGEIFSINYYVTFYQIELILLIHLNNIHQHI